MANIQIYQKLKNFAAVITSCPKEESNLTHRFNKPSHLRLESASHSNVNYLIISTNGIATTSCNLWAENQSADDHF